MDRITSFMRKSQVEYRKYKKTNDSDYLAQAGEKLWNALLHLIEKKVGKKLRSFSDVKKAVSDIYQQTGDNTFLMLFNDAYSLHKNKLDALYIRTYENLLYFKRGWT